MDELHSRSSGQPSESLVFNYSLTVCEFPNLGELDVGAAESEGCVAGKEERIVLRDVAETKRTLDHGTLTSL